MKSKGIMAQMKKEKRKSKKSLWMVTPLGVVKDSKMSGEESPLEVHYT